MANVYFGAFYPPTAAADGNWNNVANWYSTTGSLGGCCCGPVDGLPLGRLPNASTDTVNVI